MNGKTRNSVMDAFALTKIVIIAFVNAQRKEENLIKFVLQQQLFLDTSNFIFKKKFQSKECEPILKPKK